MRSPKLKYAVLFLLLVIMASFIYWRYRAPTYHGQELQVDLTAAPDETFEILLLGDTGTAGDAQLRVAQAMESYCLQHPLKAIVLLGDNFYPSGVDSIDDPQWNSKFKKPYGSPCLSQVPFYAVLGNHDYRLSPEAQINYRSNQPPWFMPHRFYKLSFGERLQIVAIDTNILDLCGRAELCTLDFLEQALSDKHEGRETIVVGHHPIDSVSSKYGKTFQGRVLKQFLCGQELSYISGHSHHLEHRRSDECRLDMFVSGAGGAGLYAVRPLDEEARFAVSQHGFLRLKVSPDSLQYSFYDTDVRVLYSYTTRQVKAPPAASP